MESKQIAINHILVRYLRQDCGQSPKNYCLLLHGWRSQSDNFIPLMHSLAQRKISSLSLDFPGFGATSPPLGTYSLKDYANFVFDLVQKLKLDVGCIIGHSFGGRVTIKLISTHPMITRKLILIDSAGIIEHKTQLHVIKNLAKLVKPFFSPAFMKPLRSRIYRAIDADDYLATPELRDTYHSIIKEDLQNLLPQIKQPTLLLWGANDTITPLSIAETMKNSIFNSRLEILPNAGHFSFLDQPEQSAQYIVDFVL